jgi:hypothetical protein
VGDSGGTTEITLTCSRDGAATRLRCAECQAPICPACYVRTPVGLRCPACAVASGPPVREHAPRSRPRWLAPAVIVAALAVALAGGVWIGSRNGDGPAVDTEWAQGGVAAKPVRIGTGDLPRGGWILDARRADGICATLTLIPGPPGRERCHGLPGDRHIAFTTTSRLTTPSETVYLTVGVVSERTERVLVAPDGQTAWEVPALGAGVELGGRLFVAHTTSPVTTFTALGSDGSELGRIRSAPPGT